MSIFERASGSLYVPILLSSDMASDRDRFDDGGYSGGSMERPALQALLDAGARQAHRCHRRLQGRSADEVACRLAKLVEVFDECGVAFVSVTQSFNTTTS